MSIWDTIGSMKGLRKLDIELNVPSIWRDSWTGWEGILLDCLLEIAGGPSETYSEETDSDQLGLWVPWPEFDMQRDVSALLKWLSDKIAWH